MKLTEAEKRLLALHYVFPVPFNRLTRLYEHDPHLAMLTTHSIHRLAELLNLSIGKATTLKNNLMKNSSTPFEEYYERNVITPIPFSNPNYPEQLRKLIDPPAIVYCKGETALLNEGCKIAIIGSRKASTYSKQALELIVPPLIQHNAVIVSGLAKGADTLAHEAAIRMGGKTIAVLGHGFFHNYPKENVRLAEIIAQDHLLITEYPPYVSPQRWTFPMRNRIISGLSESIIVTESTDKSGTMSTVEHALDHGKDVYAVPGPITSGLSFGPNRLINEGATPIWSGYQIVGALHSGR